jgi:hypothetical protein
MFRFRSEREKQMMGVTLAAIGFTLFVMLSTVRRQRREIAQAWQNRRLFSPQLFWSVAFAYALAGAAITFSSFGAIHVGLSAISREMQFVAIAGLISLPLIYLAATRLAKPVFDQSDVPQAARMHLHSLWLGFWMLGILIGLLPMFVPA